MRAKKTVVAMVLCILAGRAGVFANYPVFDQAGWLVAIKNLYQGYDQFMNTLTMIEQNYTQMQQAYERAKSWNFESLDFNDGNFLKNIDIRDELKDAGTQINRELNNIRKIRDTFRKKNIVMNGHSYSLKDLAGLGDADRTLLDMASDTAYVAKDSLRSAALAFAQGVTEEQAKEIYAEYGVSPKNFGMIQPISGMMQNAILAVTAPAQDLIEGMYNEGLKEELALENEITKKLLAGSGDDLTATEATQTLGLLQKLSLDQMRELNRSLRSAAAYAAWRNRYEDELARAKESNLHEWEKIIIEENNHVQEIF